MIQTQFDPKLFYYQRQRNFNLYTYIEIIQNLKKNMVISTFSNNFGRFKEWAY